MKAHLSVPDPEHAGTPALIAVNGVGQSLGFAPHGPGLGDSGYQTGDYTFTGDSRGQVSYPGMTGRFYIMWARTPWNCG